MLENNANFVKNYINFHKKMLNFQVPSNKLIQVILIWTYVLINEFSNRFTETSPKLLPMQVSNELYHQPPLSPHVNVPNSVQNYERYYYYAPQTFF